MAYLADIAAAFNAAATPYCQAGESEDAVRADFLEALDSKKTSTNGLVSFAEFNECVSFSSLLPSTLCCFLLNEAVRTRVPLDSAGPQVLR